jgi:hypothetical protein
LVALLVLAIVLAFGGAKRHSQPVALQKEAKQVSKGPIVVPEPEPEPKDTSPPLIKTEPEPIPEKVVVKVDTISHSAENVGETVDK